MTGRPADGTPARDAGCRALLEALEPRTLLSQSAPSGDPVLAWNEVLLDAVRADRTAPPLAARNMAMVQIAVADAVNAIEPRSSGEGFVGYRFRARAKKVASVDAAVATAARDVLVKLFPAQQATFDAALGAALGDVPDGRTERLGVRVGHNSAKTILRARRHDGAAAMVRYMAGDQPGDWQPTPPAFQQTPTLPQWPRVKPFAMKKPSQFRPPGAPALDSAAYAEAFNDVKVIGRKDSAVRSDEQTQIARFWADGAGTATPPGHWNEIAQDVAVAQGTTVIQNARLFALLNVAMADAGIAAWDCKYKFDFWRPVTAIRAADADGNPATDADPTWEPLLNTPAFPSYTSGHSTFSAAAARVLGQVLGRDDIAFVTSDDDTPGVERSFAGFSAAAAEAGRSRIYGGIHWQFDNADGLQVGAAVADQVVTHVLQPRPPR